MDDGKQENQYEKSEYYVWGLCPFYIESGVNNKYYQRCDLNKDGRLDYNEFKALIYRNKERKDLNAERAKAMVRRKSSKMQELREMKKSV